MENEEIIEMDGSIGHGQVVRTAVALSALTLRPIRLYNIRKDRPNPGLAAQHLTGVKTIADFCHADIKGLHIGSQKIEFIPKRVEIPPYKKIDIGTAGSIGMLLQTLTPMLIYTDKSITIEITGGTDVRWAPTTTYFQHIFCDFLKKMGAYIHIETVKYGFYPKGGGVVKATYHPMERLEGIELIDRGELKRIDAWSIASENLKKAKVAERQFEGFRETLGKKIENVHTAYADTLSTGSSLHAHAHYGNCKLGAGSLGVRGKAAEVVGKEAANELIKSMYSDGALDKYMTDQILPYLALAQGSSKINVEKITEHCQTNIRVVEKFLPVRFDVDRKNKTISVEGTHQYLFKEK